MRALRELIEQSTVLDLGPLPAPRLAAGATVGQALPFLARGRRGAIVVVDGNRPIGILTERDVLYRLASGGLSSDARQRSEPLGEIMTSPPETIRRQATLGEAIVRMDRRGCRHLVVVDRHDDLRGLLTAGDVMQFLTDQFPEELVNLPPRLRQQYRRPEGA